MPNDICCFRFRPAPGANPHGRPRSRPGPVPAAPTDPQPSRAAGSRAASPPRGAAEPARTAGAIRTPRLAQRHYLARAVAPGVRPGTRPQAQQAWEGDFSMGPPGPLPAERHRGGAAGVRANAPGLPRRRTPGEALRVAGSPQLPESPQLPACARRAHTGRTPPHTHSHALHTHGVSGPTPVPKNPGSPHPARAPPSSLYPSPLLRRPGTCPPRPGSRGPPIPEARQAAVHQHRAGCAPGPDTRTGGRGGAAPGAGTGSRLPGHPHHHHDPPVTTFSAAQKVADGTVLPMQPTGGSPLLRPRRAWGRGARDQGGRGAGLRRRGPG